MKILENQILLNKKYLFRDQRFQGIGEDIVKDLFEKHGGEGFSSLPWITLHKDEDLSFTMISHKKEFVIRFITEMTRKWIIPGKISPVSKICVLDFEDDQKGKYYLIEISLDLIKEDLDPLLLEIFMDELRLGLTSSFYAYKILSMKGLDHQDKLILVQDKIMRVLHRFLGRVEYDLIPFMQSLLFSLPETFMQFKSEEEISRMILYFYFLSHKASEDSLVGVKLKTSLQQTLFSTTFVLSVYAYIGNYPLETTFHKEKAILFLKSYFPALTFLEDSFLIRSNKQEQSACVYFELEYPSHLKLSYRDLELLKELVTHAIEQSVRQLPKPVIIPSNREAAYKDLLHLSGEVRVLKDIPQLMLSFDEIKDQYWVFTLLGVAPHEDWIQKVENVDWREGFFLQKEMIKRIGFIRKKHPKMGLMGKVWIWPEVELKISSYGYYDVRKKVLENLEKILGPVRDYHGGMIEYQWKKLESLKEKVDPASHFLIETFFLSIHQQEYLSLWNEEDLFHFFNKFEEVYRNFFSLSQNWHVIEDSARFIGYQTFLDIDECQKQVRRISELQIPSRLFLLASYQYSDKYFLGFMTRESESFIEDLKEKVGLS